MNNTAIQVPFATAVRLWGLANLTEDKDPEERAAQRLLEDRLRTMSKRVVRSVRQLQESGADPEALERLAPLAAVIPIELLPEDPAGEEVP